MDATAKYDPEDGSVLLTVGADTFQLEELEATELYFSLAEAVMQQIGDNR